MEARFGKMGPWQPAEDEALKAYVKECTGDELTPLGNKDSLWVDLARRWEALGNIKGFRTNRSDRVMYERHRRLRKKAGVVVKLPPCSSRARSDFWSAEEEKALLAFVKERKGDEMAGMCSGGAFKELETDWQSKGFDTARSAVAMYVRHNRMRKKRAEQIASTPQQSTTSSTTSATAQAPSLRRSGRKRTASAAALTMSSPSANAKKPKPSPSPSASAATSPPPPPPSSVRVKNEAPASAPDLIDVKIEVKLEIKEERNH